MLSKKLFALTSSSLLIAGLAGCASNQEGDESMSGNQSSSSSVAQSSSRMSVSSSSSSSSSSYSLSSAEMLSKKSYTVYFDFDSAKLDNKAETTLQQLPKIDNYQTSAVTMTLTGHADATGPEAYNQALSRKRAEAVRDAIRQDVPSSVTINIEAEGESEPMSSNESEYGRSKNRRVEITYSAE